MTKTEKENTFDKKSLENLTAIVFLRPEGIGSLWVATRLGPMVGSLHHHLVIGFPFTKVPKGRLHKQFI